MGHAINTKKLVLKFHIYNRNEKLRCEAKGNYSNLKLIKKLF